MNPGVYVHIPFCQSRCSYCHFTTRPWESGTAERYWKAVVSEILSFEPPPEARGRAGTVYFGGGTPSLVPPPHLEAILDAIRRRFGIVEGAEISLEANPGTVSCTNAAAYQEMGINRVSLGAQSFDDTELRSLGRVHSAQDVRDSVRIVRDSGISNVSFDLMLGLPDQTAAGWRRSLAEVSDIRPEHLSVYMFDVDVASPLQHSIEEGSCRLPDDDLVADLYEETIEFLDRSGYEQYEISNFALSSRYSLHNLKYWMRRPVIGFGISSHSFDGTGRFANTEVMAVYLEAVEKGIPPVLWRRSDDPRTALGESFFLGLRLIQGVDCEALRERFGPGEFQRFEPAIQRAIENGMAVWEDGRLRLTRRGMLLSNEVFREFV
jgi:oxygen-independent coproporphyrinogen III oxidase